MRDRPAIGDRVRLTAKFLRSTGQYTGQEPMKRWLVVACECGLCSRDYGPGNGRFTAVNEPSYEDPNAPRHINLANLERA